MKIGGGTNTSVNSDSNVISGNTVGVRIANSAVIYMDANFIGTNSSGSVAVGNLVGIDIVDSEDVSVGDPFLANLISGNETGIRVRGTSSDIRILGNGVGTDVTGSASPGIPNTKVGILIESGLEIEITDNKVVRTGTAGSSNISAGITVSGGNAILKRNLVHDNAGSSISVASPPGVITLTQARVDGFALGSITGATPNTAFTFEFFAATNPGQAEQFIGTSAVVTDADGNANFEVGGLGDLPPAKFLTATITGPRLEGDDVQVTSELASGVIPTSAIIRGLPTRGPEGRPISLKAFAVGSTVTAMQ